MNREQATFGIGGVAFGFMAGFVLAYALMAPPTAGHAPAPVATPGPAARTGAAPTDGGPPHEDVMATLEALNQRLEQEPDNVEVLLELANLYLRAGISDQALDYLGRVESADPGNFQGLMFTAMAYEGAGRSDDALRTLERMQAEHEGHWETHYLTAIHYMNGAVDLDLARQAVDRIEELRPGLPMVEELRKEIEHLEAHGPGEHVHEEG